MSLHRSQKANNHFDSDLKGQVHTDAPLKFWSSMKPFLRLLIHAEIPWLSYLIFFVLQLYVTERSVRLSELAGMFMDPSRIEEGMSNASLIAEYAIANIAIVCIGFLILPMSWISLQFGRRCQSLVWRGFLHLPVAKIFGLDPSTLVSRVTNDAGAVPQVLITVTNFFRDAWWLYLASRTLFRTDAWFAVRIIPIIALSVLVTMICSHYIYRIYFRIQQVESKMTAFLAERFSALLFIKANQAEAYEIAAGEDLSFDKYKAQRASVIYQVFYSGYRSFLQVVLMIVVLIFGAIRIQSGLLEVGQLMTILFLAQAFPGNVQAFFTGILTIFQIKGQTQVISEISELPREDLGFVDIPEGQLGALDLNFEGVDFSYPGADQAVLKELTAHIPAGKMTVVVGPSGSGKTTLLRLLERFYDWEKGEIRLGEQPIQNLRLDQWRRRSAYVLQDSPLLPGTVGENIAYGYHLPSEASVNEAHAKHKKRGFVPALLRSLGIVSAPKSAELGDFSELSLARVPKELLNEVLQVCRVDELLPKLEKGLETDIGDLGEKISAGQRQRVTVARALISNPELLLLDEATANMDPKNDFAMSEAILQLRRGKTTVVVSHRMHLAQKADQVIVMDAGRVLAQGSPEALYAQCDLYREMVDLQLA